MRRLLAMAVLVFLANGAAAQLPRRVYTEPQLPDEAALDRLNLHAQWHIKLPIDVRRDGISSMQHMGSQILIQLRSGPILVLDAETGALDWATIIGEPYPIRPMPGFSQDLVLVTNGPSVVGLDRKTGMQRWDLQLTDMPVAPPSAGRLLLYVPLISGRVATFSLPEFTTRAIAQDEKNRAKISDAISKIRAQTSASAPTVSMANDPRLAFLFNGTVRQPTAMDLRMRSGLNPAVESSSRFIFRKFTPEEEARAAARPVFMSLRTPGFPVDYPLMPFRRGVLVTGSQGGVLALQLDPKLHVFEFRHEARLTTQPVISDMTTYLASSDGQLQAIALTSGKMLWRWRGRSVIATPPLAAGDSLYVTSRMNGVYRIDRTTGLEVWNNTWATTVLAANDKFVYTLDRLGRLQVLDRERGQELSHIDAVDFNVTITNSRSDRLIMASHDGTLMCLRDRDINTPIDWNPPQTIALPKALQLPSEQAPPKPESEK